MGPPPCTSPSIAGRMLNLNLNLESHGCGHSTLSPYKPNDQPLRRKQASKREGAATRTRSRDRGLACAGVGAARAAWPPPDAAAADAPPVAPPPCTLPSSAGGCLTSSLNLRAMDEAQLAVTL